MKQRFEVWMEGYACNGDQGEARLLLGDVMAYDFAEACYRAYFLRENHCFSNMYPLVRDEFGFSIYGCRLYDNEQDARKSYG